MKLVDLEPQWLERDGWRFGFIFRSPTNGDWLQSCFTEPTPRREQFALLAATGRGTHVQPCNPSAKWTIAGGIASAAFETMTVTPSLDGSAGGLWHGFITNGEIVGGLP